jgi:hypothetical protein
VSERLAYPLVAKDVVERVVVDIEAVAVVGRGPQDADVRRLQELLHGRRWEAMGGVVDVLGEHDRRDVGCLALVIDDPVELDIVCVPGLLIFQERILGNGETVDVKHERTASDDVVRPEFDELVEELLALRVVERAAAAKEFINLRGPLAVVDGGESVEFEHVTLDHRRGHTHVEVDRVLVDRSDFVDVVPHRHSHESGAREGRQYVIRSDLVAVAPFGALAELDLEDVPVFKAPFCCQQREPLF